MGPKLNQRKSELSQRFFNPSSPIPCPSKPESSEIPDFILWVKEGPFIMGVLSPTPCAKIGVSVLRKVAEYCREKEGYYPEMSLVSWGHISKYKLLLPIELSWSFLRMFDILTKPLDTDPLNPNPDFPDQSGARATTTTTTTNNLKGKRNDEWDARCEEIRLCAVDHLDELKLDTLKFLLFLFIQNHARLHRKFLKRSSPGFDDPWPSSPSPTATTTSTTTGNYSPGEKFPTKSPQSHQTPANTNTPGSNSSNSNSPSPTVSQMSNFSMKRKQIPEQQQIDFVAANLEDIISFLCLVIKNHNGNPVDQSRGERMSVKVVKALTLILGAASVNPHDREFKSLEECLIILPDVAEAVDYDRQADTVDKEKFVKWVKANLKLNPWGPSSAPVPQEAVDCVTGIWMRTKSHEQNRIFWNTQLYPKGWYLISTVSDQVLHLDNLKPLSSVKIHRCNNSFIYLPGVFNSITVEKCHNATIFLGPVGKVVKFTECSNLQVSAVGRIFIMWDVTKSTFNICTPCQPIISGTKNRKITLGPYNTFYPQLEHHMAQVGLGITVQKWNKPMELDSHGLPLTKAHIPNYTLMRTEKFAKLVYPFEMEGFTTKNPVDLPRNYAKKLTETESKVQAFHAEVEAMNFSKEKKSQINAIVTARFHAWLKSQGHFEELKGLRSIQKSIKAGSSVPILDTKKSIREEVSRRRSQNLDVQIPDKVTGAGSMPTLLRRRGSGNTGDGSESSLSFLSSVGDSEVYVCGSGENGENGTPPRPRGTITSESDENEDDEVFVFQGDDFNRLDCIFLCDSDENDNETDGFDEETETVDDHDVDECDDTEDIDTSTSTRGRSHSKPLLEESIGGIGTSIPMDDGLLWSPL